MNRYRSLIPVDNNHDQHRINDFMSASPIKPSCNNFLNHIHTIFTSLKGFTMTQDLHSDRILILDFGSQYTQLIARRVRESGVFCELYSWDVSDKDVQDFNPNGIILSGGPESVIDVAPPKLPQSCLI